MQDYEGYPVPRAVIESKRPGRTPTCWLVLKYPESDALFPIRAAEVLNREGWEQDREFRGVPPLEGVAEVTFVSYGTDLFRGWTPAEYRKKYAALKRALSMLGIPAYRKRLTLADML